MTKYKYVGDGPFPLFVYGIGTINAKDDVVETEEPINHKHFVEVKTKGKEQEKPVASEGEK